MLPGLNPSHTRRSYHNARSPESTGSRLYLENVVSSADDFIVSEETGLWLLPRSVAERDIEKDIARAQREYTRLKSEGMAEVQQRRHQRITRLLGRSSVNGEGCVHGGLRGKQTPAGIAIAIAEFEMRSVAHTVEAEIPFVSYCGNEDCYNSRHHEIDFGGTSINTKRLDLNPRWYTASNDGSIETLWGDVLPSVETSLTRFIAFQRHYFPFIPYAESRLTPGPVSQLTFHPLTGCWEAYMYERSTSGLANSKNGYGIMYAREVPDTVDKTTGEVIKGYRRGGVVAHNLIWEAEGNTLIKSMERNHLCNYPRCCNPLHLEQITPDENRRHGHVARAHIRQLEKRDPTAKFASLSKPELAELYVPLVHLYDKLASMSLE